MVLHEPTGPMCIRPHLHVMAGTQRKYGEIQCMDPSLKYMNPLDIQWTLCMKDRMCDKRQVEELC